MILLTLFGSALACSPADWGVESTWPAEGQTLPADIAPVARMSTSGTPTTVTLQGPAGEVSGTVVDLDVDAWTALLRFVPDAPLAPGAYTLVLTEGGTDAPREERRSFTVDDALPDLGAVAKTEVAGDYLGIIEGNTCDFRSKTEFELVWTEPDAAEQTTVLVTVHEVDGPDGDLAPNPIRIVSGDNVELTTVYLPFEDGERLSEACFALRSWGTTPEEDATSETVCISTRGSASRDQGCSCNAASTSPLPWLAALPLLGLLGLRRRR